jgi:hypothetical protein
MQEQEFKYSYNDWLNGRINEDINELYFKGELSLDDHTMIMQDLIIAKDQQIENELNQLKKSIINKEPEERAKLIAVEIKKMERFILDEQKNYNEKYAKIKERKMTLYPSADLPEVKKQGNKYFFPKGTKIYDFINITVLTHYYEWLKTL